MRLESCGKISLMAMAPSHQEPSVPMGILISVTLAGHGVMKKAPISSTGMPVLSLAARFANAAQCPAEAAEKLQYLIFPIAEAESIPEAWRGKTLLELPRVMFGRLEQKTAARLDALQDAAA